jgi:hypothetical protein
MGEMTAKNREGQDVKVTFTDEQIERLQEIAEERDVVRDRQSRFSHGEQDELDDTARTLGVEQEHRRARRARTVGFNPNQQAQLDVRFRNRWLPLIGYLAVIIAVSYAVSHVAQRSTRSLARATLEQCQRENARDENLNNLARALRIERTALVEFGSTARTARAAAYKLNHQPSDLLATRRYAQVVSTLSHKVQFSISPPVDCKRVIPRP